MSVLYDLYQQGQIHQARTAADSAAAKAEQTRRELDSLNRRVDFLALANQALLELLRQRTGITDSEVVQRMQEIDQRDGVLDGKITPAPADCPHCGRKTNSRRRSCVFCGGALPVRHVFERH